MPRQPMLRYATGVIVAVASVLTFSAQPSFDLVIRDGRVIDQPRTVFADPAADWLPQSAVGNPPIFRLQSSIFNVHGDSTRNRWASPECRRTYSPLPRSSRVHLTL